MRLYFKFFSIHFRSAMTYRASFLLSCLGHLLITTNVFLSVVFLLDRFDSVGGYTLPQLALCFRRSGGHQSGGVLRAGL